MKTFAILFPGQGSQSIGMMSSFAKNKEVKNIFKEASDILGYDLWKLIQYGTKIELNKTWKTQPAILTASIAIYNSWLKYNNNTPKLLAGHSLGEYTALVCAKVIKFSDAIKLVELRGKLMQETLLSNKKKGAMTAIIGLKKKLIVQACKEVNNSSQEVFPVNFNSPEQTIISGYKHAVKKVIVLCKKMGAKTINLSMNIPAHSPLMKPAAKKLKIELNKINFNKPNIPVVNNAYIKCEKKSKAIINALVKQMYYPIYWTEIIKFITNKKINHFIEIGPGKILTNLLKKTLKYTTVIAINNENKLLKKK